MSERLLSAVLCLQVVLFSTYTDFETLLFKKATWLQKNVQETC